MKPAPCLKRTAAAAVALLPLLAACSPPSTPEEVKWAAGQERGLLRIEAPRHAPGEYRLYREALEGAREEIDGERRRKIPWLRRYDGARRRYLDVLRIGEGVRRGVERRRDGQRAGLMSRMESLGDRAATVRRVTEMLNEGSHSRTSLTMAELQISRAVTLLGSGDYDGAGEALDRSRALLEKAEEPLTPLLERLADAGRLRTWNRWVAETVETSRKNKAWAIVVSKVDRTLTLYKDGRAVRSCGVGLGSRGSSNKLYAGDNATPEGRYRVVRKNPASRYYRALLIDYPNDDDRRAFAEARKRGDVPRGAGIGGLVELHGGGTGGMTFGCVSLDDADMGRLYDTVPVGTPVTIVGSAGGGNGLPSLVPGGEGGAARGDGD